jgi:hypothetical protein
VNRRLSILVTILIAASLTGLALFFWNDNGGGYGRGYGAQANETVSSQRFVWLALFAIPLSVAIVVVVYSVLFPKIRVEVKPTFSSPEQSVDINTGISTPVAKSQSLEAILRILNSDERKIVEALASQPDGTMLQKDLKFEAGLSRVKTHRVLARLVARRIVTAEKYYNSNKITLANWIANCEENKS